MRRNAIVHVLDTAWCKVSYRIARSHHAFAVPCISHVKGWKCIVEYDPFLNVAHCLVDCKFHLMLLNLQGKVLCAFDSDKRCAYRPRYCRLFDKTLSPRAIIGWVVLRGYQSMKKKIVRYTSMLQSVSTRLPVGNECEYNGKLS